MLVVDDEREITHVLSEFLTGHGHEVWVAHSGTQALALARQRSFDVVFLDIVMPEMDGNATLRQMKVEFPDTVVIMISGAADENVAMRSLRLGAFDYISKPFDFAILDRVVSLGLAMRP